MYVCTCTRCVCTEDWSHWGAKISLYPRDFLDSPQVITACIIKAPKFLWIQCCTLNEATPQSSMHVCVCMWVLYMCVSTTHTCTAFAMLTYPQGKANSCCNKALTTCTSYTRAKEKESATLVYSYNTQQTQSSWGGRQTELVTSTSWHLRMMMSFYLSAQPFSLTADSWTV